MAIHVDYMDYYNHDEGEYVTYIITLKIDDFELEISDPGSISDDKIDNLIHNKKGCVGGGGNSSWEMYMKDDSYMVEFSISGSGGDAKFKYKISNIDIVNELLLLIKEINYLSCHNIKYESISDHITVTYIN